MTAHSRSLLPHFLAAIYGLAIAGASLQPFSPWIAPVAGTPFFLFAPGTMRFTRFDIIANVVAYVPWGFFVALLPRERSHLGRIIVAIAAGVLLSFTMETLQMFVPPRDASAIDLVSDTAGAAMGGIAGALFARSPRLWRQAGGLRNRFFLRGRVGDLGLALVAVWLVAQVNPGIPLFAIGFDPQPWPRSASGSTAATPDFAAALVEGAHSAFQVLGVGLFVALLLRERRHVGGSVFLLIGVALAIKGTAAAVLLKPTAWEHWLSPGVSTGIAAGVLALGIAIWLPRPAMVVATAVALLSSLTVTALAPELLSVRAPLVLFSWSYGHLLNFNGLTRLVLLGWPIAASVYLFALAAKPAWGQSDVGRALPPPI